MLLFTRTLICLSAVLWHCWLGGRKGIRPVKNWALRCWRGYLSGARCRLAYGPADAIATHCLLLQKNPDWFYLFRYRLTCAVPEKWPLNGCVCVCFRLQRIVSKSSSGMQNMATFAALCPCAYKFGHKNKYLLTTCPAMDRDKTGVASVVSKLL